MRGSTLFKLATFLLLPLIVSAPSHVQAQAEAPSLLSVQEIVVGFNPRSRTSFAMESLTGGAAGVSQTLSDSVASGLTGFGSVKPVFANARASASASVNTARARQASFTQSTYVLRFRPEMSEEERKAALVELMALPGVEYVEPNYRYHALKVPNDHFYSKSGSWGQAYADQWNLKIMDVERAWDLSEGQGIVVAVIDTGVDYTHPDLAANMWSNSREVAGNGIDDDGNGFIDDIRGWDFTTCASVGLFGCTQEKAPDNDPRDGHGHGTHCSGTVAAVSNNQIGVAGVAPKARIMAIKGLDDSGGGSLDELAAAVVYAVDNGADIINASWGGEGESALIEQVFEYAKEKGVVALVAAGNSNKSVVTFSPAGLPSVVTVASSDENDKKSDFSNFSAPPSYGPRRSPRVDIAAPGGGSGSMAADSSGQHTFTNILSLRASGTDMYNGAENYRAGTFAVADHTGNKLYYRSRGTSMAAPGAAGVAALVLSKILKDNPSLNRSDVAVRKRLAAEVKARLILTTDALGENPLGADGKPIYIGSGRVNAWKAINASPQPHLEIVRDRLTEVSGNGNGIPDSNEIVNLFVALENRWADSNSVTAELSVRGSQVQILDGSADYGSVRQGEIKDNAGSSFKLKIGQISGMTPVNLVLTTTAQTQQGQKRQSLDFTIFLGAKKLSATVPGTVENFFGEFASPDGPSISGRKIAWTDVRNGNADIYVYDFDTNREKQITTNAGWQEHPAISGDTVVWQDDRVEGDWDLYYANVNGGPEIKIPVPAGVATNHQTQPDIDGTKIVWSDQAAGGGFFSDIEVYSYDTATGLVSNVTNSGAPQFNPRIGGGAMIWEDVGALGVVYSTNPADATNRTNLSPPFTWAIEPDVDGQNAAFVGATFSGKALYTSSVVNGTPTTVKATDLPGLPYRPRVSGNNLVWEHSQNGKQDVWFKDLVSGQQTKVTNSPGSSKYPAISGNLVAWVSEGILWATEIGATYTPEPAIFTIQVKGRAAGKKKKWVASKIAAQAPQIQISVGASDAVELNLTLKVNGTRCSTPIASLTSRDGTLGINGALPKASWVKNLSFGIEAPWGEVFASTRAQVVQPKKGAASTGKVTPILNVEAFCQAFSSALKAPRAARR